jgi:hypothetical protein
MKNAMKYAAAVLLTLTLHAHCLKFDDEAQLQLNATEDSQPQIEGRQSGRHLLDFIGLGTGDNVDPFIRRTNEKCLNGELAECFKSQALNSFDEIFYRDAYT